MDVEMQDSDSGSELLQTEDNARQATSYTRMLRAGRAALGVGTVLLLGTAVLSNFSEGPDRSKVSETVGKYGDWTLQEGASAGSMTSVDLAYSPPAASLAPAASFTNEDLFDGNPCGNDEELFESLCYKKCSLLTAGKARFRTSAFSCCEGHPCMTNQKVNFPPEPCSGFDIGGNINGEEGECPHAPGSCLKNEEMVAGVCYKKCTLLTDGAYPHRVAAATCCKATGVACLNPYNLKTDFLKFIVGGGRGDGNPATPGYAHAPLKSLTEQRRVLHV